MALTLTKLRNRIALALGGSVSSKIDQDDIINEAGRLLTVMHPWKFLERPPTTLDFTSGTAYVALPADFGQLVSIRYNSDSIERFILGTFDEIAALRPELVLPSVYVGSIVHPGQTGSTSAPPVARIELVPTPGDNITAALAVWYRARWTEITYSTGSEVPNVPDYVHSLLSELVAAVAQGYNERDAGSMSARLTEIQRGPLFLNAIDYDGLTQPDYGEIGPGAAMSAFGRWRDPVSWASVSAPS